MYYGFYVMWVALGSFLFPNTPGPHRCSHVFFVCVCEASVKIWTLKHLSAVFSYRYLTPHIDMFMKCCVGLIWLSSLYADDVRFYMPNEFGLCLEYWSFSKFERGEDHLDLFLYIYQLVFFLYDVQVCVYLNMLRVPEIPFKPNELSVSLSLSLRWIP